MIRKTKQIADIISEAPLPEAARSKLLEQQTVRQELIDDALMELVNNYRPDLNSPLTTIMTFSKLIEQGVTPSAEILINVYEAFKRYLLEQDKTLDKAFKVTTKQGGTEIRIAQSQSLRNIELMFEMYKLRFDEDEDSVTIEVAAEIVSNVYETDLKPSALATYYKSGFGNFEGGWEEFFKHAASHK